MASAPPFQVPLQSFPGLEYFGNVGRGLALERRGVIGAASTATAVAANTIGTATITPVIDAQFGPGKGIYFSRIRLNMAPADQLGQLQIVGTQIELQCPFGQPIVDVGFPLATLTTPTLQQTAVLEEDWVLTFADALQMGQGLGSAIAPGALTAVCNLQVKNLDAANPHSFSARLYVQFHIFSGLLFP